MKLIDDVFNLITWLYLKTVSGLYITYQAPDESVDVIYRLLYSRTRTSSSFNSVPYVEVKIWWGVYIPPLNHVWYTEK